MPYPKKKPFLTNLSIASVRVIDYLKAKKQTLRFTEKLVISTSLNVTQVNRAYFGDNSKQKGKGFVRCWVVVVSDLRIQAMREGKVGLIMDF